MKKYGFIIMASMIAAGSVSASSVRMLGLGDISSNLDTKNIGQFPQRLMMSSQHMWLGGNENDVNAGVRYVGEHSALQISASLDDGKYIYAGSYDLDAYNRLNAIYAMKLGEFIIGGNLKFYNGSSNQKRTSSSSSSSYETAVWYLLLSPGLTIGLDDTKFIDVGLKFGTGSWNGVYKSDGVDLTDQLLYTADGWLDMAIDARLYMGGDKMAVAPYVSFMYSNFGYTGNDTTGMYLYRLSSASSDLSLKAGSGLHFNPSEKIKVLNELEFLFVSSNYDAKDYDSDKRNFTYSRINVLPTYRFGIESMYDMPEDNFLDQLTLRAGFVKSFSSSSNTYETRYGGASAYYSKVEDGYTSGNDVVISLGVAVSRDNMTLELSGKGNEYNSSVAGDLIFGF